MIPSAFGLVLKILLSPVIWSESCQSNVDLEPSTQDSILWSISSLKCLVQSFPTRLGICPLLKIQALAYSTAFGQASKTIFDKDLVIMVNLLLIIVKYGRSDEVLIRILIRKFDFFYGMQNKSNKSISNKM